MKALAIVCIFSLLTGTAVAQGYKLDGTVNDADDHTTIPGAVVKLRFLLDSVPFSGMQTDDNGKFQFPSLPDGSYKLEIDYLGYKTVVLKPKINGADKHLGAILLVKNPTTIKDVPIIAKEKRVEQRDDTTEYNANAYKVNPDANAEDLVTKMPGITSMNGTVTAQGETVQQVYVDGKEFFGQDATLALKNLPADMIDKVQVFDHWTDQAQFTGFDDGNSQKAINITTKKNKRNGIFGKVYAGYGYLNDNTYTVGGAFNWFDGNRRISVIGMSNNINVQNFSTQDLLGVIGTATQRQGTGMQGGYGGNRGGGSGGGSANYLGGGTSGAAALNNFLIGNQPGISTTSSVGFNYGDLWGKKKKVKITGTYFFNDTKTINYTNLTQQYYSTAADVPNWYKESDSTYSRNLNHRFRVRMEYTIDSFNKLIFTPNLNLQQNTQTLDRIDSSSFNQVMPFYSSQAQSYAYNFGYNTTLDMLWQHKFKKRRRTFSLDLSGGANNKNGNTTLNSSTLFYDPDSTSIQNQQANFFTHSYTASANAAYTEPVGKTGMIQINYSPSNSWNISDKNTFNYDSATENYNLVDSNLTNKYNDIYMVQKGGVTYRYSTKHLVLNIGVNAQYALLTGQQTMPFDFQTNRHFFNVLPTAMINFKTDSGSSLRIFLRTSTSPPSISQLQDVINNSNPVVLTTGNPYLDQAYTYSFLLRYGLTNKKKATSFFVFASASYTADYVANSTYFAPNDTVLMGNIALNKGSQLVKPVNMNGYVNTNVFVTYGFPIDKIRSNMNLTGGLTYTRAPGYLDDVPNWASTYNINAGVVLGSNISKKIDFTISYTGTYNIVLSSLQKGINNNYFNHAGSVKFNWLFWKGFVFNTSLQTTLYEGVGPGFNEDIFLWNLALGYKFLKDKSLDIRASVNDVLNQNSGIGRTVTGTYIENDNTQVLKRYLLLTATYTFRYYKRPKEATF